jgi:hypothetical protein
MIWAWFAARLIPIGLGLALVAGVVAWDRVRIWNAETRGAEKAVAKIERHDNAAADRIRKADNLSRSAAPGGMRGLVRDPNSASD